MLSLFLLAGLVSAGLLGLAALGLIAGGVLLAKGRPVSRVLAWYLLFVPTLGALAAVAGAWGCAAMLGRVAGHSAWPIWGWLGGLILGGSLGSVAGLAVACLMGRWAVGASSAVKDRILVGQGERPSVEVAAFIAGYTAADRSRIEFRSNGELGPALNDANAEFRSEVCCALRKGQTASDELVRDLYDAESRWSEAAWCVPHETIAFLATELLRRGGTENVRHYLECIGRGIDCYHSSLCVRLSPEQRSAVLAEMERLISAAGEPAARWREIMMQIESSGRQPDAASPA